MAEGVADSAVVTRRRHSTIRRRVNCLLISNEWGDFRDLQHKFMHPRHLYNLGDITFTHHHCGVTGLCAMTSDQSPVNWFFYTVTGVAVGGKILIFRQDTATGEPCDLFEDDSVDVANNNYYELRQLAQAMYLMQHAK